MNMIVFVRELTIDDCRLHTFEGHDHDCGFAVLSSGVSMATADQSCEWRKMLVNRIPMAVLVVRLSPDTLSTLAATRIIIMISVGCREVSRSSLICVRVRVVAVASLGSKPRERILDLSCGTGELTCEIHALGAAVIVY